MRTMFGLNREAHSSNAFYFYEAESVMVSGDCGDDAKGGNLP